MPRLPFPPSALQVWAVEDTALQVTWGSLPAGTVAATVGATDVEVEVEHEGGPGSLGLGGLEPGRGYEITLTHAAGQATLAAETLPAPPGHSLCKVATISDLHLGSTHWGASKLMVDRSDDETAFPLRCAIAAVSEAIEWGAELLIIKGDAAHHEDRDHFALVGQLVDAFDEVPVVLIAGNHDVDGRGAGPRPAKVGERGTPYVEGVASEELPGLRVVVADTNIPGKGHGRVDPVADEIVELAEESTSPYLLGIHHQLQPHRFPTYYPPGIAAPASTRLLDRLAAANPSGLVTSGHTHRNRARTHGPLVVTEVGSTRDWPGVWAGYAVHEGGIRQVVRRAAAMPAIRWHEYSRRALLGMWSWWAAGPIDQRCFTHPWEEATPGRGVRRPR